MKQPTPWLPLVLGAAVAATLTGCPDTGANAPTGQQQGQVKTDPNGNPSLVDASGKPLDLAKLSQFDTAKWSSMAIGADGTLHAVFTETPKGGHAGVYYRASTNGGATWSAPVNLMDADRSHDAGVARLVVDGAGRVYALWKVMPDGSGPGSDSLSGGAQGAPLRLRVLNGGTWSDPVQVDANKQVRSWFATVDPAGQVHVVWSENLVADTGYQTIFAARVMQTQLTGTTVAAAKQLIQATPSNADARPDLWYLASYLGLRGYVDAQGTAHFSAYKIEPRGDEQDANEIVWNGTAESPQFRYGDYAIFTGPYYNPPELVRDDAGTEHLLVQDAHGDRKGVLDFAVGSKTPTVVRQAKDATGDVKTMQVIAGPQGRLAALVTLRDASKSDYDLFVSRYDGGRWNEGVNVTNNAVRGTFKTFKDSTQVSTTYEPSFGAGAFGAGGQLNLVLVNDERASISTNEATVYGDTYKQGAIVANPNVYFVKL